jgi:hypothetical protein
MRVRRAVVGTAVLVRAFVCALLTEQTAGLPEPARRYVAHAVAPGAFVATAVRLSMHGEIKQKGNWYPF